MCDVCVCVCVCVPPSQVEGMSYLFGERAITAKTAGVCVRVCVGVCVCVCACVRKLARLDPSRSGVSRCRLGVRDDLGVLA